VPLLASPCKEVESFRVAKLLICFVVFGLVAIITGGRKFKAGVGFKGGSSSGGGGGGGSAALAPTSGAASA